VAALVLGSLHTGLEGEAAVVAVSVAFVSAFGVVGALLASRRPSNPLGWIMGIAGLGLALAAFGDTYAYSYVQDPDDGLPGAALGLWLSSWGWMAAIGPAATFLLLLFPTGRPPSPRWRPVAWLAAAGLALGLPGAAFRAGAYEGYNGIENPIGLPGAAFVGGIGLAALTLAAVLSAASLFARYRRAGFQERQQLKWLLFAGAVVALVIVVTLGLEAAGVTLSDDVLNGLVTGSVAGLPVAIGIAILRHRLYDIDVVINRTVVYGALTVILAGAYLGSVLLLQLVLSPDSDLAIAGSTLAVAALVRPARRRIQELVDRRFFRRKYDAQQTLDSFGGRLRNEVDIEALGGELRGVVRETMQPTHVSLWLKAGR
jgi:hypothetical protein